MVAALLHGGSGGIKQQTAKELEKKYNYSQPQGTLKSL